MLEGHAPWSGETKPAVRAGSATTRSGELAASTGVAKPLGRSIYQGLPSVHNGSRADAACCLFLSSYLFAFLSSSQISPCCLLLFLTHMPMEIQPPELTVADMLRIHRAWITMLFVEQKKTEAEIVQILYERNISVSWVLHSLSHHFAND